MTQKQGSSSAKGGRVDGSIGTAIAASDFALGAGWGASTVSSVSGNDQRGTVVITCATGGGLAQATSTVTLTFKDGAYAATPFALVQILENTQAVNEEPTSIVPSTTTLAWKASVIPVNTKVYTYGWVVIA